MEDTVSVKYVFIPADLHQDIEERSIELPKEKECEGFLDHLKQHFRVAGGKKTAAQAKAQKESLMQQLKDGGHGIQDDMLEYAINNMQMVENIALLSNSPDNGFIGVNMYCDDEASIKQLPSNPRATSLVQCCGHALEVRGDIFLARVFDNEDDFRRIDFRLAEVSSSAQWVQDAAEQQRRKRARSSETKDFLQRVQSHSPAASQPATVRELSPAEQQKEAGNAAFKKGDWRAAVELYTAAIKLDGSMLAAYNNRAMAYLKLGMWQQAEEDASRVLQGEPRNVKALLRRGTAREGLQLWQQAAGDLQAALQLQPGNKEAQQGLQRLQGRLVADGAAAVEQR